MLLMLTIVAVTGLKRRDAREILLKEIIESVDMKLNQSSKMVRTEILFHLILKSQKSVFFFTFSNKLQTFFHRISTNL